ncbi:uncharacterized protein LOC101241039 isoform X3 [Hydra vulgaris]|uniref:Uncharacterized protein LOC101241039 isoform X3 n=1 Tax=Hydra vulgaris TaxID=6087 RepID=A0ABM4CI86_HYDVU
MINKMTSFSHSLSKFVLKLGEGRKTEKKVDVEDAGIPLSNVNTTERPRSPFIMLLSEGDEEFNFNPQSNSLIEEGLEANEICNLTDSHPSSCSLMVDLSDQDISAEALFCVESCPSPPVYTDKVRSYRNKPLSKEKFEKMFDESGRLVNEHDLRKAIFKGGVEEVIRKEVWVFLFELYPFNTTARERDILAVENTVRYEAMKIRWKTLLKGLVNDYESVYYCPKWFTGCPKNANEYTETSGITEAVIVNNTAEVHADIIEEFNLSCPNDYKNVGQFDTDHLKSNYNVSNCSEMFPCPVLSSDIVKNVPSTMDDATTVHDCYEQKQSNSKEPLNIIECCIDQNACLKHNICSEYNPFSDDEKHLNIECIQHVELYESLNSEDISKALADAMIEYTESDEKKSLPSGFDSFDLLSEDAVSSLVSSVKTCKEMTKNIKSFGGNKETFLNDDFEPLKKLLNIPKTKKCFSSQIEYINNTSDDFLDTSSFTDPFEDPMLQKSKNMQESLYSKSENFKSIDLSDLPPPTPSKSINLSERFPLTSSKPIDLSDFPPLTTTNIISNQNVLSNHTHKKSKKELSAPFDAYDSECHNKSNKNYSSVTASSYFNDNSIFKPISPKKDCINSSIDCSTSPETSFIYDDSIHNGSLENNGREDFPDSRESPIFDNSVNEILVKYEADRDGIKSPTGEILDNLPPWIAQMIKASTPPQSLTKLKRAKSLVRAETSNRRYTRLNSFDSALPYDNNLLGIVENANKYLLEQMHLHTEKVGTVSLSQVVADELSPKEPVKKSDTSVLDIIGTQGIFNQNDDSFLVDIPKFQFILNNKDFNDSLNKSVNSGLNSCPYCNFDPAHPPKIILPSSTALGEEQLKFIEIQAQVFAARQPYDEKMISASIRVIDKDVPRTDRELPLFKDDNNPGLVKLRDSLLTYAFFHPEVGYAQGMNDIMSRFLFVMDTEAEAYWTFVNYMEHFKKDFMEEGMLRKISLLEQLLMKMDRELYDVLQSTDMGLMFCHRWLLLNFKREFDYKEALRLFEITSSRHLEVSSLEAEMERYKERAKEFENNSAGTHQEEIYLSPEYPFDIFVCVAMLMECRNLIMDTANDICAIYHILSKLPTTLDLSKVLQRSEELFYQYCRKTVVDCFQVIDELEIKDFKRNKFSYK